jgi:hypothetical protein
VLQRLDCLRYGKTPSTLTAVRGISIDHPTNPALRRASDAIFCAPDACGPQRRYASVLENHAIGLPERILEKVSGKDKETP